MGGQIVTSFLVSSLKRGWRQSRQNWSTSTCEGVKRRKCVRVREEGVCVRVCVCVGKEMSRNGIHEKLSMKRST